MKISSKLIYSFIILFIIAGCFRKKNEDTISNNSSNNLSPSAITEEDNSFLATLYVNEDSQEYKELTASTVFTNEHSFGNIKLKSNEDNLKIRVDYGEWINNLNFFHVITSGEYETTLNKNEVVQLPITLSEGSPEYALRLQKNGISSTKYLTVSSGEINESVINLYESEQEFIYDNTQLFPLIGSRALYSLLQQNNQYTDFNYNYWASISYSIFYDIYTEDNEVRCMEWLIEDIAHTMYPNEEIQEYDDEIVEYTYEFAERYILKKAKEITQYDSNVISIYPSENNEYTAEVRIYNHEYGGTIIVKVILKEKTDSYNSPYKYEIIDVIIPEAKG